MNADFLSRAKLALLMADYFEEHGSIRVSPSLLAACMATICREPKLKSKPKDQYSLLPPDRWPHTMETIWPYKAYVVTHMESKVPGVNVPSINDLSTRSAELGIFNKFQAFDMVRDFFVVVAHLRAENPHFRVDVHDMFPVVKRKFYADSEHSPATPATGHGDSPIAHNSTPSTRTFSSTDDMFDIPHDRDIQARVIIDYLKGGRVLVGVQDFLYRTDILDQPVAGTSDDYVEMDSDRIAAAELDDMVKDFHDYYY